MAAKPSDFQNAILCSLGPKTVAALAAHLEPIELTLRQDLERPNVAIKYVYFPESGIASVTNRGNKKKQIEIGIIGREGVTGLTVVLGNDRAPHHSYVQVAGSAHRLAANALREAMANHKKLRILLLRYVQAFMTQTSYTAIANGTATMEERLARWLLMAHDRIDGDDLPLIHDFLAVMLGVHRPGVTVALSTLENNGLIRTRRSVITVIDRGGLEELANGSYGVPETEYARLMAERIA